MLRKLCERFFLLLYLLKDLLVFIILDVVADDLRHIRNCDKCRRIYGFMMFFSSPISNLVITQ